jgi:7,8-dihydropterin-6-yl-methyl-4-(beta-D-ribofuranosyl)aminobenzene 5'-phosphate synthase
MIIKVLSENNAVSTKFDTEHGLSLYIETGDRKILFDTGESDVFLKNAERLNVNLADIDLVVISHGHIDHGGGLRAFFEVNRKAPVYLNIRAVGKYYSDRPNGREFIGLSVDRADGERMILTEDYFAINQSMEIFSNVSGKEMISLSNKKLKMEKDGKIVDDTFEHEHNLIVTEAAKTFLFEGCAHNGIINILDRYRELKNAYPDYVFGGFHLMNPSTGQSEDPAMIRKLGEALKDTGVKYYTGHCTGTGPYDQLKAVMGEQIEYLAAGRELEL